MKLSIIIPTYNCAHLIKRAIDSIINQGLEDYEIIVVDDNSSDNTEIIIKEINNKNIKYYLMDKNYGVSHSRNFGIKHSKGEYIIFCDSDDEQTNKCSVKLLDMIEKGYDLVVSNYTICEKSKQRVLSIKNYDKKIISSLDELIKNLYIADLFNSPVNKIYKKSIIEKHNIMFDETLSLGEDYRFNLDYISKIDDVKKIKYINESLYLYYRQSNGLSLRKTKDRINVKLSNWEYHISNTKSNDLDYLYKDYLKIITLGLSLDKNITKDSKIKSQLFNIKKNVKDNKLKIYSWMLIHLSYILHFIVLFALKIKRKI